MATRCLLLRPPFQLYRIRQHSFSLPFSVALDPTIRSISGGALAFGNERISRSNSPSARLAILPRITRGNSSMKTLKRDCPSRKASCLKRFLVASMPYYYYYYFWFAATVPVPAEGLLLLGSTSNHGILPADALGECRSSSWRHAHSQRWGVTIPSPRKNARCFSTTSASEETDTDTENNDDDTFSTSYHAPVMVHECLDALLDCQRGRIRTPNRKSSYQKKKRKGKGKRKNKVTMENEESNSKDETTQAMNSDAPPPPLVFVDGTLGGGGHSNALLQRLRPGDIVLGCDVDPNALQTASERLSEYMNHSGDDRPLFVPVSTNFGDLAQTLPSVVHPVTGESILKRSDDESESVGAIGVDGILLDLGVSSHQIDEPERGFSFMRDGPLDMRMGRGSNDTGSSTAGGGGLTAADICNEFDASELQRIFSVYGDEPRAKTIARAIVQHRPLRTTGELVAAIASVTPEFAKNKRHGKTATCARVFQSLRIVVNDEDGVLARVLSEACPALLRAGGMLVVMSYHSMEDRATKRIMRDGSLTGQPRHREEKDLYGNYIGPPKPFQPVQKRRKATEEEIARNPRARSAILRVAERQNDA